MTANSHKLFCPTRIFERGSSISSRPVSNTYHIDAYHIDTYHIDAYHIDAYHIDAYHIDMTTLDGRRVLALLKEVALQEEHAMMMSWIDAPKIIERLSTGDEVFERMNDAELVGTICSLTCVTWVMNDPSEMSGYVDAMFDLMCARKNTSAAMKATIKTMVSSRAKELARLATATRTMVDGIKELARV